MGGLPGLAAFEKKQQGKPFRLIGIHCQPDTAENIVQLCKSKGVEFTIMESGEYSKKQFNGIPHAFVFDHTGKEIFEGHPSEAEAVVEKALLAAPSLYLGDAAFVKLKDLAAKAEKRSGLGQVALAVRKKLESADEAEKAEAGTLLKALEDYAQRRKDSPLREEDPDQYLADLNAAAKEFSGDSLGTDLKAEAEKAAADPEFQKARKGMKEVAAQEKALEALPSCKSCKGKGMKTATASCASCKKANEAAGTKARKALEAIAKKYEGTPAAAKAQELASRL